MRVHQKYLVRGMVMYFWRVRENGALEFYHYQTYGDKKHIIYFWDKDLRKDEVTEVKEAMLSDIDQAGQLNRGSSRFQIQSQG